MKSDPIIIQVTLSIHNGAIDVLESKILSMATNQTSIPPHDELEGLRKNPRQGENSGTNKLTEVNVRDIRRLYKLGASQVGLGKRFGVTSGAINHIILGTRWGHVK